MEPINPDAQGPLVMEQLKFINRSRDLEFFAYSLDDNDKMTLQWTNATLTIRAGTARAWLELGIITTP